MKLIIIRILFIQIFQLGAYVHATIYADQEIFLKNDKLIGMHAKYSPAFFDLNQLTLTVKDKKLIFPKGIKKILMYQPNLNGWGEPLDDKWKLYPYTFKFYILKEELAPKRMHSLLFMHIVTKKNKSSCKIQIDMNTLKFVKAEIHDVDGFGTISIDLDGIRDNEAKKWDLFAPPLPLNKQETKH